MAFSAACFGEQANDFYLAELRPMIPNSIRKSLD